MASDTVPTLRTPGVVAREIGAPLHRVQYILKTRKIVLAARAGRLRLLDGEAVRAVQEALARMDARRAGR